MLEVFASLAGRQVRALQFVGIDLREVRDCFFSLPLSRRTSNRLSAPYL
jgi:hypothetical protein